MKLSILIISMYSRMKQLTKLTEELMRQGEGKSVEVLTFIDNKKRSIGAKRNTLLQQAQGDFVCFVDDDDDVSSDYVDTLCQTIEENPKADCIVFQAEIHVDGHFKKVTKLSRNYENSEDGMFYYRQPNHIMCYRRSLACQYPFPEISFGEDTEWATVISQGIKEEVTIDKVMYYYRYVSKPRTFYFQEEEETEEDLISIIMLTKNQLPFTRHCIDSIYEHTDVPFELIIVDNASTDGTVKYAERLMKDKDNVKVIYNQENKGFGGGNNQGIRESKGNYILFLNNDVIVTDGWLSRLVKIAKREAMIGIVGPMTNCAGSMQQIKDEEYNVAKLEAYGKEYGKKYIDTYFSSEKVIGFCMLVKRELINYIGGFDVRYKIGNFEDDDLCVRAGLIGYKCVVAQEVFIHHFGSMTFKGSKEIDTNTIFTQNAVRFLLKWGIPIDEGGYRGWMITDISQPLVFTSHYAPLIADTDVVTYLKEAVRMFNNTRSRECEAILFQGLELYPKVEELWINLMHLYIEIKDYRRASACLHHVREDDTRVAEIRTLLMNQTDDIACDT